MEEEEKESLFAKIKRGIIFTIELSLTPFREVPKGYMWLKLITVAVIAFIAFKILWFIIVVGVGLLLIMLSGSILESDAEERKEREARRPKMRRRRVNGYWVYYED